MDVVIGIPALRRGSSGVGFWKSHLPMPIRHESFLLEPSQACLNLRMASTLFCFLHFDRPSLIAASTLVAQILPAIETLSITS